MGSGKTVPERVWPQGAKMPCFCQNPSKFENVTFSCFERFWHFVILTCSSYEGFWHFPFFRILIFCSSGGFWHFQILTFLDLTKNGFWHVQCSQDSCFWNRCCNGRHKLILVNSLWPYVCLVTTLSLPDCSFHCVHFMENTINASFLTGKVNFLKKKSKIKVAYR